MGDGGQGRGDGWWLASDGQWYPPPAPAPPEPMRGTELHRAGRSAEGKANQLRENADRYSQGADGERRTAQRLSALPPGWIVFHDLHVPGSEANVDHLVIGPTGVFVIDSKAHRATFTERSGTLWRGRTPIRREMDTVQFIASQVGAHLDTPARSILCFTDATLPRPVVDLGTTVAVTLDEVNDVITNGPPVHSAPMVEWLARLASELTERVPAPTPAPPPPANRAPRRAARVAQTRPAAKRPTERKQKQGAGASLVAAALVIAVAGLAIRGALNTSASSASTTTTTVPTAPMSFACPSPGAGYTGTPNWPDDLPGFTPLEVSIRAGVFELSRQAWSFRGQPLQPLTGLQPGAMLTVTIAREDRPNSPPSERQVTVPSEPC